MRHIKAAESIYNDSADLFITGQVCGKYTSTVTPKGAAYDFDRAAHQAGVTNLGRRGACCRPAGIAKVLVYIEGWLVPIQGGTAGLPPYGTGFNSQSETGQPHPIRQWRLPHCMSVRPRQLVCRLERSDIHPLSVDHQTSTPESPLHPRRIVPEPKATFQTCVVSSRGAAYASTDGP